MPSQRSRGAERLIALAWLVAALGAVGMERYATGTVHSECVVAVSRITSPTVPTEPDLAIWTRERDVTDRAFATAVESGRCEPPRKRWELWFD
ncbi:hypothetical protein [Streptomyces sp. NPDC057702]|uniref:hypothetical protein n=1 Tax=unclassified Streptomyces TaxID=2593676 RepID=UPI0036A97893